MSTQWTQAQQAAIQDRGGGLLVSAAAGSGKTAVLTQRAVDLITDPRHPVEADKLLIVTFTNAAAAELRARIGEKLLRLSQADPASGWLRRQRMLLQRAPICTIDAFCLDLLRRHFEALDIPPDFVPADAGSVQMLRESALADTLEAACRNPDFCAFADLYGKGRSDDAAGRAVLQVYDFLRALPDYDKVMDRMLAPWQTENSFPSTGWHDLLLDLAGQRARAAGGLLQAALADCRADLEEERARAEESRKSSSARAAAAAKVNDKFADPLERLESACALMERVGDLAGAGDWESLYNLLTPYVLGMEPEPGLKGMKGRLAGPRKAAVKTRAQEAAGLFGEILELIPCSQAEAEQDRALAAPRLAALFEAVRDFDARFAAKKRERKLLEFSDFEHLALKLLRGPDGQPTPLCEGIRAGYGAVMVDEYQDTNALQDALYSCLAAPDGGNLFLVGDLKQSIYRFRQADPAIFREKLESWPPLPGGKARPAPAQGQPAHNALLALDANFRSAPAVVEGINFFFEQLMSPDLGDTAYGEGQRLVCGAPGTYQGAVEACLLPDDEQETDAAWIAGRIADLVAAGEPVREGGAVRPVRYEDCCILLAARADFPVYTRALADRGIPVYADARENLFEAPHIRPLVALLKIIDNPAQDIYLAAAMLGPVFGFTDDELVQLRARKRGGSLYGAVAEVAASEEDDPFSCRVRGFYARLAGLRRMARSMPAERLMEEIFASTGYLAALGAMENGQRRREDARRFAAFCAGNGGGGISALVRAIDAASEAGGDTGDTVPGSARPGCVTIMTIHRSKGLQFPVVFLADTARKFNAADLREPVLLHRVYGAGLRLRQEGGELYKTAAYTALGAVHEREMRSEQMRLLYVALTRAQDRLIVTLPLGITRTSNPLEKAAAFLAAGAGPVLYSQCNSFAGWLRAALLVHPNGGPLRRQAGDLQLPFVRTDSVITLTIPDPAQPVARPEPPAPEPADPALAGALRERFDWQYPAAGLSEVPAKVSVTSIVHKAGAVTLERPAFLTKEGLSAAEMGTALHAFMEHADFAALAGPARQGGEALARALAGERDRQTAARLTAPQIAEKLDLDKLAQFFAGEAFRRVLEARQVLREYAFITALPAGAVLAAQGLAPEEMPAAARTEQVLVQGIADILLVFPDHLELLDYKTDRGKTEADFLASYRPQLNLYAIAVEKRFAPRKVTYKGIYSFSLGKLIDAD